MKHHHNSWKRIGGLTVLALAGLLASQAARAELMDFETSTSLLDVPNSYGFNLNAITPAAYQPIPYVHVGYSSSYLYTGIYWLQAFPTTAYRQFDHTTGSYGGTHYTEMGLNNSTPLVYTFDQPVSIPSLFVNTAPPNNYVVVRAFADTSGASLLSSNTVPTQGPQSWTEFTGLAALGTNIMRLEVAGPNTNACVDDITIYGPTYGTLQGIQFQLAPAGALQPGMSRQPVVLANYTSVTNNVTTWATFTSSDTSVATVPQQAGVVTAASPGTANIIATFGGLSATQTVTVGSLPTAATLVTFNNATNYTSATVTNLVLSALSYNPIPSVSCRWTNVVMFNGGPDHTCGVVGYTNWVAAQTNSSLPQIYTFNKAMSLPSLWLTTLAGVAEGGSNVVTIKGYSDTNGTALLGTVTVATPTYGGAGNFQWVQATDLDNATYNGLIRRVEISAPGKAQVDDMAAVLNYGTLTNLNLTMALTTLKPGMSRQLIVTNKYSTGSNVVVTATALYGSSDPSVATVSTSGRVQAVGPGSATISAAVVTNSATAQGVTNSLTVTVSALPANATLVTFNNGGWPEDMYNFAPITPSYQPVPDLFISYPYNPTNFIGVSLYNGVPGAVISGVAGTIADHTTGVMPTTTGGTVPAGLSGGNNYTAIGTNAVLIFNRPVGIPSLYLANLFGTTTKTTNVVVQAWSDAVGTVQIYSNSVPTLRPTNTFTEFTGLASKGNTIMRLSFACTNWASFDDLTVVAPPLGALQALHLLLPQTNCLPNTSQSAGAFADYANVTNVNVTAGCGTAYTSSDPSILTVSTTGTGVVVRAVASGTATLTATLGALSDSVTVFVGIGALTNLHLHLAATSLVTGDSEQATVLGDYEYTSGVDVTTNAAYSSTDPAVVTVSASGLVTAVGPGSATVSASLDNTTNSVAVTVFADKGALTDLHLQLPTTSLTTGASEQATVLVDYEHKAGVDVTASAAYSSTDPAVVTVSAGGLVTAVGAGSATVSATLSNLTSSVALTVSASTPLIIWPLGDSIVLGVPAGGPRLPLYRALTNASFAVDLVGSTTANCTNTLPDCDHDGHGGYIIVQIDTNFVTWSASLDAAPPDIILLQIGGNDYIHSVDLAHVTNRLDTLISHLTAYYPTARVVVDTVPVGSNATLVAQCETGYNAYIPGIVGNHQALGERVFFCDIHGTYGLEDLGPGGDGAHPMQSGCDKMATNGWFKVITNIITGQLLDFNHSLPTNNLNSSPIPSICQPIPKLTVTYQNVGLRNTGPDHTTGASGGNRYNAYQYNAGAPQVFLFDKAVTIPSVWLTTASGGDGGASLQITVKAYADTNGATLLSSNSVATTAHSPGTNYAWTQFTGLTALGGIVRRVEFASDGNAQVDDMTLVVNTARMLTALNLQYTRTNLVPTMSGQTTVLADYTDQTGVNVTANASYSSSNPSVATVSASGLVRAVGPGTTTITASLQAFTDSVDVVVTALPANATLVNFNDGLPADTYNFALIPASYEPVPNLSITYTNVELFNGIYLGAPYIGPDHTAGTSGGNAYLGFTASTNYAATLAFDRPVGIPSVWLTTSQGGSQSYKSTNILVRAYADTAGNTLLYSQVVPTPTPVLTWQTEFKGLASLGTTIRRLDFTSTGVACFDDMTVLVGQQPAITTAPVSQIVECGGNAVFTMGASGDPAPALQWRVNGSAVAGATSSTFTTNNVHSAGSVFNIACSATNAYGSVSSNATLTVQDTTAPVPDLGSLQTVTGQCSANVTAPTAHDACDGLITGTTADPLSYTTQGTFTVHWTYTDSQGHSSTQNQTVSVQDTQAPLILWSFTNAIVSADTNCQALMPDVTGTNYILASDCSALLTITQTPTNNAVLALGTNEVVIAVDDGHGHVAYSTNTIVVADTTSPDITILGDNPLNAACHGVFTDPGATASDNCAGVISLTTNSTVDLDVPGTYSIAYIATDAAGNSSTNVRTVVVSLPTVPPGLGSSENPAGFKDSLVFTATLPADATGSVTFLTNGVSFVLSPLSAGAASCTNSDLPRGTNLITAIYSGDANYLGSSGSLNQVVTNHPPVAIPMTVMRTAGMNVNILISDILTNVTDADGDVITNLASVLASANGVTLPTVDDSLYYHNANNVVDQVQYLVDDGFGGTATGQVNIVLEPFVNGNCSLLSLEAGAHSTSLTFQAIPGYTYITQRATDLGTPVWVDVSTNTAGSDGVLAVTDTFTDLGGTPPFSGYYRLRWR